MMTAVEAATALVLTGKVALVAPAATVTLPATVAAELLLDSVTGAPPSGAGPLSVTVPVGEDVPPVTLEALRVSEDRIGTAAGVTVSVAVLVAPP